MKLRHIIQEIEFSDQESYLVVTIPVNTSAGHQTVTFPNHYTPTVPKEVSYHRVDYSKLSKSKIYDTIVGVLEDHKTYWDRKGVVDRREIVKVRGGREVDIIALRLVLQGKLSRAEQSEWAMIYLIFGPTHPLAKGVYEWTNEDRRLYFDKVLPRIMDVLKRT